MVNYLPLLLLISLSWSQDTFSIVAVNSSTGEVASAGASCISGSIIISDIHPGIGVIHTQALWNPINQDSASSLMEQGYSPESILNWLIENDAENNPSVRQYGIIDLLDGVRSAGYTGEDCYNYKNHITGPNYAIQGNILLGQDILDTMEFSFLNQYGTLDEKILASLMAANITGADTRCQTYGTPAISAFIRIASSENSIDSLYLDINVNSVPLTINPLDSLFSLYWEWKQSKFETGDINFDKKLDILDVLILSDYINQNLEISEYILNTGDFNSSGAIEITDLFLLVYEIIDMFNN